jgi:hypothetical protein
VAGDVAFTVVEDALVIPTLEPDSCEAEVPLGEQVQWVWADSFSTWIEIDDDADLVHLIRTKPDRCEAYLPEGMLLHFTWAQLGVTRAHARLVNPIWKLIIS